MRKNKRPMPSEPEQAAGNGLLDRRLFLTGGAAAAIGSAALPNNVLATEALPVEPWMKTPGSPFVPYGQPSRYASKVARIFASVPGTTGTGASRTPHHLLDGMITPNGLHFERHHSGIPDINPEAHRLLIHGLVKRPLVYTLDALMRSIFHDGLGSDHAAMCAAAADYFAAAGRIDPFDVIGLPDVLPRVTHWRTRTLLRPFDAALDAAIARRRGALDGHSLEAPRVNTCPQCGSPKLAHRVCPTCGTYKGREVERFDFPA